MKWIGLLGVTTAEIIKTGSVLKAHLTNRFLFARLCLFFIKMYDHASLFVISHFCM